MSRETKGCEDFFRVWGFAEGESEVRGRAVRKEDSLTPSGKPTQNRSLSATRGSEIEESRIRIVC